MKVKINKSYTLKELFNVQKLIDKLDKDEYKLLIDFWDNLTEENDSETYCEPVKQFQISYVQDRWWEKGPTCCDPEIYKY